MGLGKTIQTIALIATNEFGKGPTLIVCPVSVMSTWKYQIEEHVQNNAFRSLYEKISTNLLYGLFYEKSLMIY